MRQVAGLISTYSSDEFGVCSALYELGGMVVMHDASGCNSTYTTHDEPRWYEMDSMIFISAISEMEAIMGDDEKFIRDLVETARKLNPAFIAVVGAPIPYMIGTDFEAIARITQERTGISCLSFPVNGMHNYLKGMSMAMAALVERFCKRNVSRTKELSVNLLGVTPLDFSLNGSVDSMKNWALAAGMQVNACLAMGSTLEEIALAGQAHVNLVVSYGGLEAARKLEEMFGTSYVAGVPVGRLFAEELAEVLITAAHSGKSAAGYYQIRKSHKKEEMDCVKRRDKRGMAEGDRPLAIVGEYIYSASLATAIELEHHLPVQVLCPLDIEEYLLREGDLLTPEEDDLMFHLPHAAGVIADPLYRAICPEQIPFYSLPHEAFSGRIYDAVNPNLIDRPLHKQEE